MITIMVGSQGSGKTLYMTKTAFEQQGVKDIYSNYKLNFSHKKADFKKMLSASYNNALILIDEAHIWGLDSRSCMSKNSKELVKKFIVQCRKQGVDLLLSTQRIRQIDVRVRENADFLITLVKWIYDPIQKKLCQAIQSQHYPKDHIIIIEQEVMRLDDGKMRTIYFKANDWYDKYNTREVIRLQEDD